jgi:hypothetical protein
MWTFVEQHSSDSSAPEDLLAKLHDFPHVPSEISLHVEMFPSDFYHPEDRVSRRDSSNFASLVIDTAPETVLEELPLEEEADTADACLHVSRVLRGCVLRSLALGILDLTSCAPYFQLQPPWFSNGALRPHYQCSHIQNRLPPAFT